jgi:hypothetical protein
MWNVILGAEVLTSFVVAYRIFTVRPGWDRADCIFWAILVTVGMAIVWIKWVEPLLIVFH